MQRVSFLTANDMDRLTTRIALTIQEKNAMENVVLIGVHTGGAVWAKRIGDTLAMRGHAVKVGVLDITPFRDDNKAHPKKNLTQIDFDIFGKDVVLVDDVLFTGRTIRAALNAINQLGRAKTIQLAVMVDRGHRELPIKPDYVGKNLPTSNSQRVEVQFREVDGQDAVDILESKEGIA